MAGKNCTGVQNNNSANLKNSRAFCEGREYRGKGTAATHPSTDNPHEVGSEANFAWATGWQFVETAAGTYVGVFGCCSAIGNVAV